MALSYAWGADGNTLPSIREAPESSSTSASAQNQKSAGEASGGISANPGAVNIVTGSGELGRLLGFGKELGVHLGGLWVGDANYLLSGGANPGTWSFNSLFVLDLSLDFQRLLNIQGAQFGVEFLQFNGQPTNQQAGVVSGYNSLPGPSPLDRSELYQLWWRQQLFDDKLVVRVGKTVPTYDFNNVLRPVPVEDQSLSVPSLSALVYTPIFVNPTLLGSMPGYYNSAYGITATLAPTRKFYIASGIYDGNLARGEQTGLGVVPRFNGYTFTIGEIGYAWLLGPDKMPGTLAVGGWRQTGTLSAAGIQEDGAQGFYAFASQRLWLRNPGVDSSGITGFFQSGINNSNTMPVNKYAGAGLTAFGLLAGRAKDSMGVGAAVSWLNQNLGFRNDEVMFQAYYQIHVVDSVYLQPTVTYVPNPGQSGTFSPATAITMRTVALF
ncbi:MAG: carbohydrate porin [Thermodesulfobacteriota bacterium]|jgi:porin